MPDTLTPDTRKEIFYKGILDRDASDLPDPETREELWLKMIAEGSGSVSFYDFGTSYEFTVDGSTNITKVVDGYETELDLDKIKPRDLLGAMLAVNGTGIGIAYGGVFVDADTISYQTLMPQTTSAKIYICTINFTKKKLSYQLISTLS